MKDEESKIDPRLFSLKDDTFYRETDGKEIARLVDGEIVGLHHKQERFRETLESLVSTPKKNPIDQLIDDAPDFPEDETPIDLFHPRTGDMTPAVIEWRKENWSDERLQEKYEGRNIL